MSVFVVCGLYLYRAFIQSALQLMPHCKWLPCKALISLSGAIEGYASCSGTRTQGRRSNLLLPDNHSHFLVLENCILTIKSSSFTKFVSKTTILAEISFQEILAQLLLFRMILAWYRYVKGWFVGHCRDIWSRDTTKIGVWSGQY